MQQQTEIHVQKENNKLKQQLELSKKKLELSQKEIKSLKTKLSTSERKRKLLISETGCNQ